MMGQPRTEEKRSVPDAPGGKALSEKFPVTCQRVLLEVVDTREIMLGIHAWILRGTQTGLAVFCRAG